MITEGADTITQISTMKDFLFFFFFLTQFGIPIRSYPAFTMGQSAGLSKAYSIDNAV